MAGYGSKSENLRESSSLGVGIHSNVALKEVKAHTTEPKKEGADTYEVLDFTFKNAKGDQYTYRVFNPEKGDALKIEQNAKDAADKVVYILAKLSGKPVEIPDTIESWEEFCAFVKDALPKDYDKIALEIKLIGNVYNGRANVQAPNIYKGGFIGGGWIRKMSDADKLTLSDVDKKSIATYEDHLKKGASVSTAAPTASGDQEVVF